MSDAEILHLLEMTVRTKNLQGINTETPTATGCAAEIKRLREIFRHTRTFYIQAVVQQIRKNPSMLTQAVEVVVGSVGGLKKQILRKSLKKGGAYFSADLCSIDVLSGALLLIFCHFLSITPQ